MNAVTNTPVCLLSGNKSALKTRSLLVKCAGVTAGFSNAIFLRRTWKRGNIYNFGVHDLSPITPSCALLAKK